MKCPFCGHEESKVVDSRDSETGETIRRRRECLKCEKRFTTYERVETLPLFVVKKDGRREEFDRTKLLRGLITASKKRNISHAALEGIVFGLKNFYVAREDRKVGHVAAVKREEVVVQERAKIVEAAPIRIEPQVMDVPKSQRIEKEKQSALFVDMDSDLPPLSLLDEAPPVQQTVSVETLEFTSRLIEKKLSDFGVQVKVIAAPGEFDR